jgi:hypothetical protein
MKLGHYDKTLRVKLIKSPTGKHRADGILDMFGVALSYRASQETKMIVVSNDRGFLDLIYFIKQTRNRDCYTIMCPFNTSGDDIYEEFLIKMLK